jgi:hypothetical protein
VVGTERRVGPTAKKSRTKIELLPAIRKLDEILKGTAKKKNKRVPVKAVYCEVNDEIISYSTTKEKTNSLKHSETRKGGCTHKSRHHFGGNQSQQHNGETNTHIYSSHDPKSTR